MGLKLYENQPIRRIKRSADLVTSKTGKRD
jgi:hypothetical protein